MIDTALIMLNIKKTKKYYDIIRQNDHAKKNKPNYYMTKYKDRGVIFRAVHLATLGRPVSYVVQARLNMHTIRDGGQTPSLDVVGETEYSLIEEKLSAILQDAKMPPLEYWQCTRIDYSYNIRTPHAELYLRLLKRGIHPKNYRDWYNPETKTYGQKDGSLYLVPKTRDKLKDEGHEHRTGARVVNFYYKYAELENKGEKDTALLEEAKEILRLEVQVFSPRLRTIKKRDKLKDLNLRSMFSEKIAVKEVALMLKRIMGCIGSYHPKSKALSMIKGRKKMHKKTKALLKQVIDGVANDKRKNSWALGNYVTKHLTDKQWKTVRKASKSLDLNMVVIPVLEVKNIDEKMLPSLLKLLIDESEKNKILTKKEAEELMSESEDDKDEEDFLPEDEEEKILENFDSDEVLEE